MTTARLPDSLRATNETRAETLGRGPGTPGCFARREHHLEVTRAVDAPDLKVRVVVREGPAYQRILDQAREDGVDLIVVGGRRPGGDYPVFGSTAVRVMRHATCPDRGEPCS